MRSVKMTLNPDFEFSILGERQPVLVTGEYIVFRTAVQFQLDGTSEYSGFGSLHLTCHRLILAWEPSPPGFEGLEIPLQWLVPDKLKLAAGFMEGEMITGRYNSSRRESNMPQTLGNPTPGHSAGSFQFRERVVGAPTLPQMFSSLQFTLGMLLNRAQAPIDGRQHTARIAFYDPNNPTHVVLCREE